MRSYTFLIALLILTISCTEKGISKGERSITASDLETYVKNLGSDGFMGRKPFTYGKRICWK